MGSLPLAFSVHHFISSVGADVGFASLIGLAILVLLYFAQARETVTLREHVEEASQRIQELEARVMAFGRGPQAVRAPQAGAQAAQQPAAGVVPAPMSAVPAAAAVPAGVPSVSRVVSPAPVAVPPLAPAGVGAPALAAATKLIPTSSSPAPSPAQSPEPVASPQQPQPPQAPPAATVAGARTNGSGQQRAAPRPVSAASVPPRIQIRPTATPAPRRTAPGGRAGSRGTAPSARGRAILFALLSLIGLAAVILILLQVTSGSTGGTASNPAASSRTTNAPVSRTSHGATVAPSSVTVAVLNGTPTTGLAHRVALKLSGTGYKEGTVATATDQTRTTTSVSYLPGFRRDALAVATSLKLGQSAVAPVDAQTKAVACPPPSACNANVVVTVGSDLASTQ